MSDPLHSPVQPGTMTQQLTGFPAGTTILLEVPLVDDKGQPYLSGDVDNAWFGMRSRDGQLAAQVTLNNGITIDSSIPATPLLLIEITYGTSKLLSPEDYTFLVAFQVGTRRLPLAGGVITISPCPVEFP